MERPTLRLSLAIAALLLIMGLVAGCGVTITIAQPTPVPPPTATPALAAASPTYTAQAVVPTATATEPRAAATALPTAKSEPSPTAIVGTPTAQPTAAATVAPSGVAGAAWIGTFGFGVNALDKAGWHAYASKVSPLPSDQIKDIAVASDNRVWISHTLGLSVTDGATWNTVKLPEGASSPAGLASDGKGGVWVARYRGVSYYDGAKWTTHEARKLGSGANVELVKDVAVAPDGKVWAVTANSVAAFDGTTWTIYEKGKGLTKDHFFEAIAVDRKGTVWVAQGSGVLMFDGAAWTPREESYLSQTKSLVVDSSGRLWAGTYAKSVSMFDGQSWKAYYMHTAGLVDSDIYALAVGGDGPDLPTPVEKAPGSISGKVFKGKDAVSGATVVVCSEFSGMIFSGPTPCADNVVSRSGTTGSGGEFAIKDLPMGRYGLSIKTADGKWTRITSMGVGDKKYLIAEGNDTYIGEMNLGQ